MQTRFANRAANLEALNAQNNAQPKKAALDGKPN
jgi:hypothetical protein